jgi:hypothetical protein
MGNLNINIPAEMLKRLKIGAIEKDEKLGVFVISLLEKGMIYTSVPAVRIERIEELAKAIGLAPVGHLPAEPKRDLDGMPPLEEVSSGEMDAYITLGYYSQEQVTVERERRGIDASWTNDDGERPELDADDELPVSWVSDAGAAANP